MPESTLGLFFLIVVMLILLPIVLGIFFSNDFSSSETTTVIVAEQQDISSSYFVNATIDDKILEHIKVGSVLEGQTIDKISLNLYKVGEPTGDVEIKVYLNDTVLSTIAEFEEIDSTTLTTIPTWYEFDILEIPSYTLTSENWLGVDISEVDFNATQQVHISVSTTDVFDGTNSVLTLQGNGTITDIDNQDLAFILSNTETTESNNESVSTVMNILIVVVLIIFILILLKVAMGYRD